MSLPTVKSIDGRMNNEPKFHPSYKKFIIDELINNKDIDNKIRNTEVNKYNYLPKVGSAAFHLGIPETIYFLIQLDRNGLIKISNIHFEPGEHFPYMGKEYFGKTITSDKLFELVQTGYVKDSWSARIIADIEVLRDLTGFVDAENIYTDLLRQVFQKGIIEWRCLICGSQITKITSLQQYHYFLNGFDINKKQKCTNRKNKHVNWYNPDAENNALTFFGRFYNMPETVELSVNLNGLLFDTNKYIIPKDKQKHG